METETITKFIIAPRHRLKFGNTKHTTAKLLFYRYLNIVEELFKHKAKPGKRTKAISLSVSVINGKTVETQGFNVTHLIRKKMEKIYYSK